ncbi:MAG: endo-1,4-beta-xylanase [Anaerolineales bacterium]|nr:endo-1,4-beta-xylanase [Anaerolineales bacterium]
MKHKASIYCTWIVIALIALTACGQNNPPAAPGLPAETSAASVATISEPLPVPSVTAAPSPTPTETAPPTPIPTFTPTPEPTVPPEPTIPAELVAGMSGIPVLKDQAEVENFARALEISTDQLKIEFRVIKENGQNTVFAVAIPVQDASPLSARYPELFAETPLYLYDADHWRPVGLKDISQLADLFVGSIVLSADDPLISIYQQEFNSGAVNMSWSNREPAREAYKWNWPSRQISYGKSAGLFLSMQHIFWPEQTPEWAIEELQANPTAETAISLMEHRLQGFYDFLVKNFGDEFAQSGLKINVLNEARDSDEDIFYRLMGQQYFINAFRLTRQMFPNAVLAYSDTYNHYRGANNFSKSMNIVRLLKEAEPGLIEAGQLQAGQTLIDGIGMHYHLKKADQLNFDAIVEAMNAFMELGVATYIEEFDQDLSTNTKPDRLFFQGQTYYQAMSACLSVGPGVCRDFTVWGYPDTESWYYVDYGHTESDATPFDAQLNKKLAYYGMLRALWEAVASDQQP